MTFKKHLRGKDAKEKKHWVRLTRSCNNDCLFCLDKDARNGSDIELKKIKLNLVNGRKNGCERAVLSGGEPTLHPQFIKIVEYAKKVGYSHIQIITNGRMFAYEEYLHKAINAGVLEITFSIHGHDAKTHDELTRVKGSFVQAMKGVKNALKIPNLIISIDVVINKINYRHVSKIIKLFLNLGIAEFDLLQVMPFGSAWKNREMLFYDLKKAQPYLIKAFEYSKDKNVHIWTNRFPAQYLENFEKLIQDPNKIIDEVRGREEMFKKFLYNRNKPECFGQKCDYCILKNFCLDLILLLKEGELRPKKGAPCLSTDYSEVNYYYNKNNFNIRNFLQFYLQTRNYVKSLRCKKCIHDRHCFGEKVDEIKNKGFKILNPVKKKIIRKF